MPYIQYKDIRFKSKSKIAIRQAQEICNEYAEKGYTLTLRQLYYQFVARGYLENSQKSYDNLGNLISDARLAGLLDWDIIEDRTRDITGLPTWDNPKDILQSSARQFKYDFWADQSVRIQVWVEKEALAGVIERIAFKHRCEYFSCRGYASQSALWRAGQQFQDYHSAGQPIKIIHLGDHDPSGIDMTRDNRERVEMFSEWADVEVIRIALNMDQVEEYKPPPNPAKQTDRRYEGYAAKYGDESWELDALPPDVLDKLISDEIEEYIDWDKWNAVKEREDEAKIRLDEISKNYKTYDDYLRDA